jgi:hypothetical protein
VLGFDTATEADSMTGKAMLERFIEDNPLSVMTRAVIGGMIDSETFDQIFDDNRERQYDRSIPFSSLALSMSEIALGTKKNRNQAYIQHREKIGASKEAYYTKLNRTEPGISEAVVSFSGRRATELLEQLDFQPWQVLPKYNAYSLDGNHLQKTEKRVTETRGLCAAPLPGTIVARYNHQTALFDESYLLEDAHDQEASVLNRVVEDIEPRDLLIADRHFCVVGFFFDIALQGGCFSVRQHGRLKGELIGKRKRIGTTDTGVVFEQSIKLYQNDEELTIRRVTIELYEPTRDGDLEVHILSNIPRVDADACVISDIYLRRWEIENAFHVLTMTLNCELKSNCYPRCALFLFCMAMFAYNARQVLLAALYCEHEQADVEKMSQYQVSVDTLEPMAGMITAINAEEWESLVPRTPKRLSQFLRRVAKNVDVQRYRASVRGPKKPKPTRKRCKAGTHVSTAKLLSTRKPTC